MSAVVRLKPGAWPAQPLTPEAAAEHVEGGGARADEVERTGRAFRRLGWIAGGVGAFAGLAGIGAGAYALTRVEPTRPYFSLINPATGEVSPAIAAADAPRHFTQDTAKQYLRMFVESCAGYVHAARSRSYARCTALMAPSQQAKYREAFTSTNPNSPQNLYGPAATLVPEALRFYPLPGGGGRIQSWQVRYRQVEYRNGQKVRELPWTATVHFEWKPDMRMTEEARTWNTAGMRTVDFSFGPDVGS